MVCRSCLQCFSKENVLIKHTEDCLNINGKQSVQLEEGTIAFRNYFNQMPVSFKIYADFECTLKRAENYEGSYTKNINATFPVVILTRLFVLIIDLVNQLSFIEIKMLLVNLLEQFLKSINIVKK